MPQCHDARPLGALPSTGPAGRSGPWLWTVTWGSLLRAGFTAEHVIAWDAEEALVVAAARRPDLARPKVAFLAPTHASI